MDQWAGRQTSGNHCCSIEKKENKNEIKWKLLQGSKLTFQQKSQDGREWHNIFKVIKGKSLQPRLLYTARLLFRFDGNRDQKLYREAKAKRVLHHQTNFTRNIKGTFLSEKKKKSHN